MLQSNVALNAARTSTIISQYMTKFAMDQVFDQPGVSVSMAVWQLRCDKFVVFSARQLYIMRLEMKPAKPSQGKAREGIEATAEEWRF